MRIQLVRLARLAATAGMVMLGSAIVLRTAADASAATFNLSFPPGTAINELRVVNQSGGTTWTVGNSAPAVPAPNPPPDFLGINSGAYRPNLAAFDAVTMTYANNSSAAANMGGLVQENIGGSIWEDVYLFSISDVEYSAGSGFEMVVGCQGLGPYQGVDGAYSLGMLAGNPFTYPAVGFTQQLRLTLGNQLVDPPINGSITLTGVPEPQSWTMLAVGGMSLAGLSAWRKRGARANNAAQPRKYCAAQIWPRRHSQA